MVEDRLRAVEHRLQRIEDKLDMLLHRPHRRDYLSGTAYLMMLAMVGLVILTLIMVAR